MIAERLEPGKIVFRLKGEITEVIEQLCSRAPRLDLAAGFRSHKPNQINER
jgi:hypothetical protein